MPTLIRLTCSFVCLLLTLQGVFAANDIKRMVPFQGRLHGADNKVVEDGVYDLTFYIYATPTGGTTLWQEPHQKVSVINGYVNVLLGAMKEFDGKKKVDFTTKKYLGISINGGTEMFPRSQLVPSFHAYTANHANNADNAKIAETATNATHLGNIEAALYATDSEVSKAITASYESKFEANKAKVAKTANTLGSLKPSDVATSKDMNTVKAYFNGKGQAKSAVTLGDMKVDDFATATQVSNINNRLNGVNGAKVKNSDTLDKLDSEQFARTDVSKEVFNNDVAIEGADLHIGKNGGGDSDIHFYDDNTNTERTVKWSDAQNTFQFESNSGSFHPLLQIKTGTFNLKIDEYYDVHFTAFPNATVAVIIQPTVGAGHFANTGVVTFSNGKFTVDRQNTNDGTTSFRYIAIGY